MIDTVALTLRDNQFRIGRPDKFIPNALGILELFRRQETHSKRLWAVCNPTKDDMANGLYYPRMKLTGRSDSAGYSVTLRVEVSLPKLLFGNNYDELTNADFPAVLDTLSERMLSQGVECPFHELQTADVSAIHYGKNIRLVDRLTCASVQRALYRANVSAWYDVSKTDFRADGHMYKIHSNDFELAFYDKGRDLEKAKRSPKRAYDKDPVIQLGLLNRPDFDIRQQVLRMEARLGSRQKIRDVLGKIDRPDLALKFDALYSRDVAQAVLLHCWKPYAVALPIVTAATAKTPADLYQMIAMLRPRLKEGRILTLVGACNMINDVGWPGMRSLYKSPKTLARLKKDVEGLGLDEQDPIPAQSFAQIETALRAFNALKLLEGCK